MERIVDLILVAQVAAFFLVIALAMVVPWRGMDGLTLALVGLFAVLAVAYGLSFAQGVHWLGALPTWGRWALRGVFIAFEAGVLVGLIRGGSFRKRKGD
jgi:hypothetical protein